MLSAALLLTLVSCQESGQKNVVSVRYIHKYGYDIPKSEWESQTCPGQVLTTLNNGKTITESYEDGLLHGPRTETFPHSQTVQTLETYKRGTLVKRISYNIRGVPQQEKVFKDPSHVLVTKWYPKGTPLCREEYKDDILINGQYFTTANETDSRIENGNGERTIRNQSGDLLAKEIFSNYNLTYTESYYPNNNPHETACYENGKLHGEKKVFSMSGDPLLIENYFEGKKHGPAIYYQNGYKYLETNYAMGFKEGVERRYIDGEILVEETEFKGNMKHGPSVVFCDGSAKTTWYFNAEKVSKHKFDSLIEREHFITTMQH